jgi:hypothetical protein
LREVNLAPFFAASNCCRSDALGVLEGEGGRQ